MTQCLEPSATSSAAPSTRANRSATLPPAILLGGGANALSVARSLGRMGVAVHVLNEPGAFVRHSRYCHWIEAEPAGGFEETWARFLLGPEAEPLHGAALLACSDDGITLIARHREALASRYLLDLSNPEAQLRMLNKLSTYEAAVEAGVPTPRFWLVDSPEQVRALRDELVFPMIVKPRVSHLFEQRFGKKYFPADSFDQLLGAFAPLEGTGIEVLLMEWIPGPDDRLCSYYTYLDEAGEPLFHFTKRIIRRYPAGMGNGCYHITDWNPEARDLGLRLFRHAGLRGLANVEFKRDERDGQLKLIECNARFTASNGLVADSGLDLGAFVYNRLAGRPAPPMDSYTRGLRLWDPVRDFDAFRELRRAGQMTLAGWLASVCHRQTFPYFRWSDPMPALARLSKPVRARLLPARDRRPDPQPQKIAERALPCRTS